MNKKLRIFSIICLCFLSTTFVCGINSGIQYAEYAKIMNEQYRLYEERDQKVNELYSEVDKYIKLYAPTSDLDPVYFVDKCMEYDFDICFALAQGHLESHFGTAGKARYTHSVWNVGSHKNQPFKSANDAVEPYIKLIKNKYVKEGKTELDLLYNFTTKNGKYRYATEGYEEQLRKYVNKVRRSTKILMLMEEIREYDKLIAEYQVENPEENQIVLKSDIECK